MLQFVVRSQLGAPREAVWNQVGSMAGVNKEFWPFLRMTYPAEAKVLTLDQAPLGERLFRSWVLLFGVIPVDYDDITLVRVDRASGFLERSRMMSQRVWEHERSIETTADGCVLTDRIRFEPRIRAAGPVWTKILRAVFRYRHHRLRRSFGGRRIKGDT